MGTTYAVTPHFFQNLQLPFNGTCVDCRSQTAQVMMHTHTINFCLPAIQRESFPGIKTKCANTQLNQASQQYQSEVEAKAKEAEALYKEYQKASASLSAAQKTQREEAIVAKEKEAAELRKKYFGPEGEMAKKQEALIAPIQDKIYEAEKQISEQKGYAAVVDRGSAQSIIFASPSIDISNEVLSRLGYSN